MRLKNAFSATTSSEVWLHENDRAASHRVFEVGDTRQWIRSLVFATCSVLTAWGYLVVAIPNIGEAQDAPVWSDVVVGKEGVLNASPAASNPNDEKATKIDSKGPIWLRAYAKVPKGWTAAAGNNVQSQSVSILVPSISSPARWWINGVEVGQTKTASEPQNKTTGIAYVRLPIPQGLLKNDQENALTVLVTPAQGSELLFPTPLIAGYQEEIALAGTWLLATVSEDDVNKLPSTQSDQRYTYDRVVPGTAPLAPTEKPLPTLFVPPEESLAKMKPADDLAVDLVLSEPLVGQPVGMNFDSRGRLWIAQYRQYPYPAGIKMLSRDKFYRAVFDQMPLPPPQGVKGNDRISIHEDRDHDGTFESSKTFVDGLNIASSALPTSDGVWILNPPYLLFYPDNDRDDVPDSAPQVHLQGFGMEDTHSVANSLRLGPDGWIYGALGSTVTSSIRVVGSDVPPYQCEGPAIWRYHPQKRKYEIFAEGGGNAFCVTFDSQGRLYSGHNGNDTRGFHYYQGAYFKKGDEAKHGAVTNPFAYGFLLYMQHPPTPRFSHSLIRYSDNSFPERYHNKLLCVDPLFRRVVTVEMHDRGSTFSTTDLHNALESSDPTFRPVDIAVGPDGNVYVADFCEEFIAHGQHYLGMINPDSGRIWRLSPKSNARKASPANFVRSGELSTDEALSAIQSASQVERAAAREWLIEHADEKNLNSLHHELAEGNEIVALESLWILQRRDLLSQRDVEIAAAHKDPAVRGWLVRLLGDGLRPLSPQQSKLLVEMTTSEEHPEVLSQMACSAKRFPAETAWQMIPSLATKDALADDPNFPMLLWWAIEAHCMKSREPMMRWLSRGETWKSKLLAETLCERIVRRLLASQLRSDAADVAKVFEYGAQTDAKAGLLRGFNAGIQYRASLDLPKELIDQVVKAGGASLALRLRIGDASASIESQKLLSDPKANKPEKLDIIRVLGTLKRPSDLPALLAVGKELSDVDVQQAAIVSLEGFDDPSIGPALIESILIQPVPIQASVVRLLARRVETATVLLDLVEQGKLDKLLLDGEISDLLLAHDTPALTARLAALSPSVQGATSQEAIKRELERWQTILNKGGGNPYSGKQLFAEHCGKCHRLFSEGGEIGPDLTRYNRDDQAAVLLSVLKPSIEIREGYQTIQLLTEDGRAISGFVVDEGSEVLTLREASGQSTTVPLEEIEQRRVSPKSLMPDDLLSRLTEEQARDLFAYLRSAQPLGR